MERTSFVVCLVLLLCVAMSAGGNKKPSVDPRLLNAQFICIVSASGNDFGPSTQSGDRAAISAVQEAVKAWGRYRVVYNEDDADILLVVRTGGYARGAIGVSAPIGEAPVPGKPAPSKRGGIRIGGPSIEEGAGVDVANVSDDMVSIYENRSWPDNTKGTSLLWRKTMSHGLVASPSGKVPLLEQFKKEIEAATQAPTAKKP